jgi:nucleoside-diphosphate-sugar epimerase
MRVLVTGADGFVGRTLGPVLAGRGLAVREAVRRYRDAGALERVEVGDIGAGTSWDSALAGCDAVVHLAGLAHGAGSDPRVIHEVNAAGTERLALASAAAGARRLVFLSTAKVFGESSGSGAFDEEALPQPPDPYARSKWDAEKALARVAARTGLEVVVLRPPLVYGPGVKANFLKLMRWLERGWPLPLASVRNRRSVLFVGNLASAIVACLHHDAAAGRTYVVEDSAALPTPALACALAAALGRRARLFPCPVPLLHVAGAALGLGQELARLTESFVVSGQRLRAELAWRPPFTFEQGLNATAQWYLESRRPWRG